MNCSALQGGGNNQMKTIRALAITCKNISDRKTSFGYPKDSFGKAPLLFSICTHSMNGVAI